MEAKLFFFEFLSMLTGVQTIKYIPVDAETSATVKALNQKENKAPVKMHLSFAKE